MNKHFYFSRIITLLVILLSPFVAINKSTAQTADLSLTMTTSDSTFQIYTNVLFNVKVTNNGPSTATNVTIKMPLPPGTAYTSSSTTQGSYDLYYFIWTVGSLPSGATATLSANLFTLVNTNITAFAQVQTASPSDPDSTPGNDTNNTSNEDDEATKTIFPGSGSNNNGGGTTTSNDTIDLETIITCNQTEVNVGQNASYVIKVSNKGPGNATGVKLKDFLSTTLQYASHTAVIGTYTPSTGIWDIGDMSAGSERTLVLNATLLQGGNIKNATEITAANQPDKDSHPNNMVNNTPAEDDESSVNVLGLQVDNEIDVSFAQGSPASYNVGDNVTFVIKLTNNGPTVSHNTKVKAFIPVGMSYVTSTATIGVWDPTTNVWVLSSTPNQTGNLDGFDIYPGEIKILQLTLKINQAGPITFYSEVRVSNQFDIDSTPNNNVPTEDDYDSVIVQTGTNVTTDLSLNMSVNPSAVTTNGTSNIVILVLNSSSINATGVSVKDILPSGLTLNSATTNIGTFLNGIWNIGILNAGTTVTLTLNVTVTAASGTITNFAQIQTANQTDPDSTPGNDTNNSANEDDEASTTLTINNTIGGTNADLSLTMASSVTSASIGNSLNITITVTNAGPANATGLSVKYVKPSNFALSNTNTTNGSFSGTTWNIGNLENGASATLILTMNVTNISSPIINFAQILTSVPTDGDSTPGNDTDNTANEDDEASVTITPAVTGNGNIDLELNFTVNNNTPAIYTNVVFTMTIVNKGPNAASNVKVKYNYPSQYLAFVSKTSNKGNYDAWLGFWDIGTLAANESATLSITLYLLTSNPVTQFAQVWTTTPTDIDSTPGNDTNNTANEDDEAAVTIPNIGPVPKKIDMELTKVVYPKYTAIDSIVTYTIMVTNSGDTTATNVKVKDKLPNGLSFVSAVPSVGTYVDSLGIWTVGNLDPNATKILTIKAKVTAIGSIGITNFAQVQTAVGNGDDSTPGNDTNNSANEDDEADALLLPLGTNNGIDLELSLSASPSNFTIYNNVTYTLTLHNNGTQAATNVVVSIPKPTGMANVSSMADAGTTYDSWINKWTVPSIAAGGTKILTFTWFTLQSSPIATFVQVESVTQTNDPDSTPGNDTNQTPNEDDEALVVITAAAGLVQAPIEQYIPITIEKIYPNPTIEWAYIKLNSLVDEVVDLQVYDAKGALIVSIRSEIFIGKNEIGIDFTDIEQGVLYIVVSGEQNKTKPIRIIKM